MYERRFKAVLRGTGFPGPMVVPINEELSGSEEPTSSYPKEHMAPSVIALTASKRLSIIIAHFFALGQITPDLHIEGQRLIGYILRLLRCDSEPSR